MGIFDPLNGIKNTVEGYAKGLYHDAQAVDHGATKLWNATFNAAKSFGNWEQQQGISNARAVGNFLQWEQGQIKQNWNNYKNMSSNEHNALALASMIPVVGPVFAIDNAGSYAAKGQWFSAATAAAAPLLKPVKMIAKLFHFP